MGLSIKRTVVINQTHKVENAQNGKTKLKLFGKIHFISSHPFRTVTASSFSVFNRQPFYCQLCYKNTLNAQNIPSCRTTT